MNSASLFTFAALLHVAFSHSIMTYPEPMTSGSCRLGGEPRFGVQNCNGPCDLRQFIDNNGQPKKHPWTAVYPPNNPVKEVFKRGQKVTVKYTRNNHGPGGFNRFTLVRYRNETGPETAKDYMNKAIHTQNAFHYSCWGARPVIAKGKELTEKGNYGLSMIGSDGQQHNQAPGYYVTDITIPPVVPDGFYILGWVWFGGTSGSINTNSPQVPKDWSYFSDYWGCSFIKIEGGVSLASSYIPVFNNDYSFNKNEKGAEGMEDGCMAQNDKPGVCSSEPCKGVKSFYRKPAAFKDGPPKPLTPANFGGKLDDLKQEPKKPEPAEPVSTAPIKPVVKEPVNPKPTKPIKPTGAPAKAAATDESPKKKLSMKAREKAGISCICMKYASYCSPNLAVYTAGCRPKNSWKQQSSECKKSCCSVCKSGKGSLCRRFRRVCEKYN